MARKFAVIGLGNFGNSLAQSLTARGAEVLAVDDDMDRLEEIKDKVAHTVRLDATEEKALRSIGLEDYDAVIVAIGDNFEASLLATSMLQQMGIPRIIVRATTPVHERILEHLGIREIILPAVEAAQRLSNSLMFEGVVDSFALAGEHTIMEASAAEWMVGKTVRDLGIREKFSVSLITIQREEVRRAPFGLKSRPVKITLGVPLPTTMIERGDVLVLFGKQEDIQRLLKG